MKKVISDRRYQIIDKLGAGDFATTFSATDLRLNRQVAIKRLHEQYLGDDGRLARYWDEAQLLASLEHPNNMTIYDVVRTKGCLVLELMQGSLRQIYHGKPMPVQDVRQTLIQALKGLQCLHENGIVHGDVNPNNLFLSRQEVVKLGDFGLARRIHDDDGSLIKGTTRYIAPEIVSEEFGQVGPASDLYSLGFSALDLMIGPEFESLFPDLIAFGRDRKMAWMMWHCSADRKFPPIESMLDGVPEDLARVLNKLTCKDQSQRYETAQQALDDLSANPAPVGKSLKEQAAEAAEVERLKKKKRLRRTLLTCATMMMVGIGIFLFTRPTPPPAERQVPPAIRGVVQNVLTIDQKLVLDLGKDWKEVTLRNGDKVILNRLERQLRDLEKGDRVTIHTRLDPEDKSHYELIAFRPTSHTGLIESVDGENNRIVLRVSEGLEQGKQFEMLVPDETRVTLNKLEKSPNGDAILVGSLSPGDQANIKNCDDESGMLALEIEAFRDTTLGGFIRELDPGNRIVTLSLGKENENPDSFVRIPLYPDCAFTLNGLASLNEKAIQLRDLKPGDRVTLVHNAKAKTMDAWRLYSKQGPVTQIDFEKQQFVVGVGAESNRYRVGEQTKLLLGEDEISFSDLRLGDRLQLEHDSPGDAMPELDLVQATRPANAMKWAILIGNERFNDNSLPALPSAMGNVKTLQDTFTKRYAVPNDQVVVFDNMERVRLQQEIPKWLSKVPASAELYVYLNTHAFCLMEKGIHLATPDSQYEEIESTGIRLDWLIDRLDECQTAHKALFVDCSHESTPGDLVTSNEMIKWMQAERRGGFPKSVYVLGSCKASESGQPSMAPDDPVLFAQTIADGFGGGADEPRDNSIEITELAEYVVSRLATATNTKPILFLPDASPPRISAKAKTAILDMLSMFGQRRIDKKVLYEAAASATRLSGGQPDANLAMGIILLKATKIDDAYEVIEAVRLKHPQYLIADRCVTWVHFHKQRYDNGLRSLVALLNKLPTPEELETGYDESTLEIFEWAGRLRELASASDWSPRIPSENDIAGYDRLLIRFGPEAARQHQLGRDVVKQKLIEMRKKVEADPSLASRLGGLQNYVERIADGDSVEIVKSWLDK